MTCEGVVLSDIEIAESSSAIRLFYDQVLRVSYSPRSVETSTSPVDLDLAVELETQAVLILPTSDLWA